MIKKYSSLYLFSFLTFSLAIASEEGRNEPEPTFVMVSVPEQRDSEFLQKRSNTPKNSSIWVVSGAVGGALLGACSNLIQTGSLLEVPAKCGSRSPVDNVVLLGSLNSFREVDLKGGRIIPMFLPGLSPVLIVTSVVTSFWIAARPPEQSAPGAFAFARRLGTQLWSNVVYPSTHTFAVFVTTALLRFEWLNPFLKSIKLDVSGHAIAQTLLCLNATRSMQAISANGTSGQRIPFAVLVAAISITDAAWMYTTTGHCHAVAEVVVGAGMAYLIHFGFSYAEKLGKKVISYAGNAAFRFGYGFFYSNEAT